MMKKIIITLLASQVGVGAYFYIHNVQKKKNDCLLALSESLVPSKSSGMFFSWESPFQNKKLGLHQSYNPMQSLPTYKGKIASFDNAPMAATSTLAVPLRARDEEKFALAVPLGKVRVESVAERANTRKMRSVGGGTTIGGTLTSHSTRTTATTTTGQTFAYRNFVALSRASTDFDLAMKAPSDDGIELPPPPNVLEEDKVLPIGDGIIILLLLLAVYVMKRK